MLGDLHLLWVSTMAYGKALEFRASTKDHKDRERPDALVEVLFVRESAQPVSVIVSYLHDGRGISTSWRHVISAR